MKRLILAAFMTLISAVTFSQSNNLLWTMTVDVKMDKKLEWEKKMVTFVKTHIAADATSTWKINRSLTLR